MKKRKSAPNKFAKNEEHAKWVIKRRRLLKEKAFELSNGEKSILNNIFEE